MKRETYFYRYVKNRLSGTRIGVYYRTKKRLGLGKLFPIGKTLNDLFPEVPFVKIIGLTDTVPKIGIHMDPTEYNGYGILESYYLRYSRFMEYNSIPFTIVDLRRSDWLKQCTKLDILIVAYNSEPSRLSELQAKVGILEQYYNVMCYPSYQDLYSYEDKVRIYYQMQVHGFNHANTFISHNYNEAKSYVSEARYPLVSKIKTGSGSRGVELVRNKTRALQIVKQNFGLGRKALWTYSYEKDYVYFQEFIGDATYDVRVFVVGDVIAGYRRRMKGKDFRASGAGLLDRRLLPDDVLNDTLKIKKKWNTTILAVDFVDTNSSKEHKIIEASISFGLDYPEYLENEGKRVFYVQTPKGIEIREGCFWVQEFIIFELIKKWVGRHFTKCELDWQLETDNK